MRALSQNEESVLSAPPKLNDFNFSVQEIREARKLKQLLTIDIEITTANNIFYAYKSYDSADSSREMDLITIKRVIDEAIELNVKSVVINGGEPTLHSSFRTLISYIHEKNITPVVITNAITMTPDLAGFLYTNGASVLVKLDSLQSEVVDTVTNTVGAYDAVLRGIDFLKNAGFGTTKERLLTRMGISFTLSRHNKADIPSLWHYCRRNNLFPHMENDFSSELTKPGYPSVQLNTSELKQLRTNILKIDKEYYNFVWLPYSPVSGHGCLRYMHSLFITIDGNARPCAPTRFDEHPSFFRNGSYPFHIYSMSLKQIYDSEPFTYARSIDTRLEGKCGNCEHNNLCMGCRGLSYTVGVKKGINPYAALRMECQQCFK